MTAHPDPALTTCAAHEARRHAPLPPLADLTDEALAIVRSEELRKAAVKLGATIDRVRTV